MSTHQNKPTKICHISDFHLPLNGDVSMRHFAGKRILGYANLLFNRGNTHKRHPFMDLLRKMTKESPDLTVITGDMVNLALDFEFADIRNILADAGFNRDNLLIVPGNHDRYTPGTALRQDFENYFSAFLPEIAPNQNPFPVWKVVGNAVVIGLDTSTWRGPLRAAGTLRTSQLKTMTALLGGPLGAKVPVVAMHHPPFPLHGPIFKQYRDGLAGGNRLIDALAGRNAIVIHGHTHKESRHQIKDVDVYGVSSASNDCGKAGQQLAYNVYTIDNMGLCNAQSVRHWPGNPPGAEFETVSLIGADR